MLDPAADWVCADVLHCINQTLMDDATLRLSVNETTRLPIDNTGPLRFTFKDGLLRLTEDLCGKEMRAPIIIIQCAFTLVIYFGTRECRMCNHRYLHDDNFGGELSLNDVLILDIDVSQSVLDLKNDYHRVFGRPFPLDVSEFRDQLRGDLARLATPTDNSTFRQLQLAVAAAWWSRLFLPPVAQLCPGPRTSRCREE